MNTGTRVGEGREESRKGQNMVSMTELVYRKKAIPVSVGIVTFIIILWRGQSGF